MDAPREAPQLRPLGIGDIVDRVFALYRSRPLLFLIVGAPPYLVLQLLVDAATGSRIGTLQSLSSDIGAGRAVDPAAFADVMSTFAAVAIVGGIAGLILLAIQSASLVDAMAARYLGREVAIGVSFGTGLRAAPRVIVAGVAVFVLIVLLWAVLTVVMLLTRETLVVVVAVLAGLFATVYIFASTLVVPVVATLEGSGPLAAIRRSWWLARGNRWRILGLQILLVVLNLVISALLSTLVVTSLIADLSVRTAAQTIVSVIATIAWAPIQWGTFTVLYYDLRVRHEAYDLQLGAEALPRAP